MHQHHIISPSLLLSSKQQFAAESEVSFSELDGSKLQIGILRTRWNDEQVSNLVDGIKVCYYTDVCAHCLVLKDEIGPVLILFTNL